MDPSSLIDVYSAENEQQAHIVRAFLADAGIESVVSGGMLQGAVGELPFGIPTAPKILASAEIADRARELILDWEKRNREREGRAEEWQCEDCGELNSASFELCWNCLHSGG